MSVGGGGGGRRKEEGGVAALLFLFSEAIVGTLYMTLYIEQIHVQYMYNVYRAHTWHCYIVYRVNTWHCVAQGKHMVCMMAWHICPAESQVVPAIVLGQPLSV